MKLELVTYPDPRLERMSVPVTRFDVTLGERLDAMAKTMYQAGGIGIAGAQVAYFERVFLVDVGAVDGMPQGLHEFINPHLFGGSGRIVLDEGCLSLPGIAVPVKRFARIEVAYQDRRGESRFLKAEGLLAVAIQHEYDHLDGVLTLDRVPFWRRYWLKRELFRRRR